MIIPPPIKSSEDLPERLLAQSEIWSEGKTAKFIQQGDNLLWSFLHVCFKGIGSMVARRKCSIKAQ